ncbi:hypothetical protein GN958_ATG12909 [Phytophthora infestans]|uniref:Uncharacterized protein n=1 Tax=Phytophthora infestans TaxID=4787 RepID=A0A8S9UB65_PHYIN|nr:hypothetical protein GN958_ATG12909 [Phytophthora infestans]
MEGDTGVDQGADQDGDGDFSTAQPERSTVPITRMEALIQAISQYRDVYPVVQRAVQLLLPELCDRDADDEDITSSIQAFIKSGALVETVRAMSVNLDSPAFIGPCVELLVALVNKAGKLIAEALWETEILAVLDKIVHSVMYQNESVCVQLGMTLVTKLLGNFKAIGDGVWTQLVSTTAQAMLANPLNVDLQSECLLSLKLLFQLKIDRAVPATTANIILKTLDQCYRQLVEINRAFASASVVIVVRILDASSRTPHLGHPAAILAAALHHYQLAKDLDESYKVCIEKLIQQPLHAAVPDSLARLSKPMLPPADSDAEDGATALQNAAMKLLLAVVWREEARTLLDRGGVAILAKFFTSRSTLNNAAIENALAQTLYYVSMHWPDEIWNAIQASGTGLSKWIEVISKRCEDENDVLLHYLLAMINTLLHCEEFSSSFARSNVADIYLSILDKHHQLPLCTRLVVTALASVSGICPTSSLPALCDSVAETIALEDDRSFQLECVKALTLLVSQQDDNQTLFSNQRIRDIVRVMRLKLMDGQLTAAMLNLVVNTLPNSKTRANFIDQGLLQVVSKAICTYQWSSKEAAGTIARWIICDIAHKLDVSRNLSTLEPHGHLAHGHMLTAPAMSIEALNACCCVVGALAGVKPFLSLLVEEGAIQCIVGTLRYAKQELMVRSEASFIQLITTCFYAANNIVNAPVVAQVTDSITAEITTNAIDEQSIYSRLVASGAEDAIIGCLEEALRVNKFLSVLVNGGCRLLHAVFAFPISTSSETENRWISVATSILQRGDTQQRTRELLFGTTLMVLSRGKRSGEAATGQHVKMVKVILGVLTESIQHESSCTLSQAECVGAIRVLEEVSKTSDSLPDTLVSRCLGVLGKLLGVFILSSSTTAQESLRLFDNAIALFATTSYVNRLVCRLDKCAAKEEVIDGTVMVEMAEDFKALEALLLSSQGKKTIDSHHRLFCHLAAVVESFAEYEQALGDRAPFFLELGCVSSQLLPTAQREEVINAALCHFAQNTAWHSMRWIAALADKGSSEFTLIVEFVLLRIVSGYSILEPPLLMELLDALNFLLRYSQCRKIVQTSSHVEELQSVLWELVRADVAHMDAGAEKYDAAVSLLGIVSSLLSFSSEIFSLQSHENGCDLLVRFCLGALDSRLVDTKSDMTKFALVEELHQSTGSILQHCVALGAEYARSILQHRATRQAFNISIGTDRKIYGKWCLVVLGAMIQSHGLLYAEKLLSLSSNPLELLADLVEIGLQNSDLLSWKRFLDCIALVNGSSHWQADCNALFKKLQAKGLIPGQTTITNSRKVNQFIADTITQLTFKYGQLSLETSPRDVGSCFQAIARSGFSFYDLFMASPNFEASEYSTIVCLHLRIARLVGLKTDTERSIIEESTVSIRKLLNPICISDEALADYLDLAAIVYLSSSVRAAAWLFIDATTHVLSKAIQRLTTGSVRPKSLEKSLLNCFSSLRAVYGARWESGEVKSVQALLKIFSSDTWSQERLLECVLVLPQGLVHLLELVRAAPATSGQVMMFLFHRIHDIRHKTQRIGELELSTILSLVKRNVAGRVGDTFQRKLREVSGSEMLRCALEILELCVRRKNCAELCSDLGGISILYDVLCAPSQYEDITLLALEICCCLAGSGADLTHENSTFALQRLLISVETKVDSSRSRLVALVVEYFSAVDVSAFNLPLIQQCRTQLLPISSRSHEESERFIQQLYIAQQKLSRRTVKPQGFSTSSKPSKSSLNEGEIRRRILSGCRTIVQCTDGQGENSYINVKTSGKSVTEPREYSRLREAIEQLSSVLNDSNMAMNRKYLSALVPVLSEILVLHTTTTTTMCTIMKVLEQVAFVHPSIMLSNDQLDIPTLVASCSLHHRASLPFARNLCRFCNSISAELTKDEFGLAVSLVPLLFELLEHWNKDFEIVDQSLATLPDLVSVMRKEEFNDRRSGDILALLNAAVASYTGNSPTSWNWLKCMLVALNKIDKVAIESAQDTICTVIGIIRMYASHNFMVERAVEVLIRMYVEKRQLPLRHLSESDGVEVLLTCLKLHANDESIVRSCLKLMVSLVSRSETLARTVDQLVTTEAAAPILLVCKENPDNPSICGMCAKLMHQMVQSFEKQPGKKLHISVLPGDTSRKKSELLTHLLEADILPLIFDLLDSCSSRGDYHLLGSLLLLLKSLTKDERLRDSAEVLHGLQELQQTIDRIWEKNSDRVLIELAVDCLVNLACSDRALGHGWRELPMWLLQLAESIHNLKTQNTGMCVEKLIGILGRLALDSATSNAIAPKGSFTILELLESVGENYSLEQALYGLLCALCEDISCAQILIAYNAIPITAERIICHVRDEETLLSSLCFFDLLALNSGESYRALQDEIAFKALDLAIQTYPEMTGSQVYRIASTTLEKVSALDYQSTRTKPGAAKMLKPQIQFPDSEKPFHDLLREGAKFRVLWEARPAIVENIQIQLAPSGDYLLFRRKTSSQLPRVERIFVSQLEVCPQRSLTKPSSPSKTVLAQSLLKKHFEGDRVLRLRVRDEDVLIKTNSARERVHWDQALQWLVSRRETRASPVHSPTQARMHSS